MVCNQKRERCIFIKNGKCGILLDTTFKRASSNVRCPFYKERPLETTLDKYFNGELFRSIMGYNHKYFVSERGMVVNDRGRSLKPSVINRHLYVHLRDELSGKHTKKSLARIVAEAFVPGTGQIAFQDGNPENCSRWNIYRLKETEDGNKQ